jgi:hypothetical protein
VQATNCVTSKKIGLQLFVYHYYKTTLREAGWGAVATGHKGAVATVTPSDSNHMTFVDCYSGLQTVATVSCCSSVQDKNSKTSLDNVRLNILKFGHKTKTLISCHNFISHRPL